MPNTLVGGRQMVGTLGRANFKFSVQDRLTQTILPVLCLILYWQLQPHLCSQTSHPQPEVDCYITIRNKCLLASSVHISHSEPATLSLLLAAYKRGKNGARALAHSLIRTLDRLLSAAHFSNISHLLHQPFFSISQNRCSAIPMSYVGLLLGRQANAL